MIELTSVQFGDDFRVADLIREQAARRGDVVALRHGARALTYAELDERSNRLAQALLAAGIDRGSRVAHLDRTAPEVVELLLATSKIGAVTVPLNWRLARRELTTIVEDAEAPLIIAGTEYADVAGEVADALPARPLVVVVGADYEDWLAAHHPVDPGGGGEDARPGPQ